MNEIYKPVDRKGQPQPELYEIRIEGHLDSKWSAKFEGMTLTREGSGDTLLAGPVVDQAALYGLLKSVRDLGMPLVSVIRVGCVRTDAVCQ